MGTINCDIEGLTNKVLPPLNSGGNDLDSAANIISSIIVPIGFDYTNEVYRIPQKIRGIKKEVDEIKNWISEVVNKFENAEKQNENILNSILGWFGTLSDSVTVNWYARKYGVDTTGKTQQQIIEEIEIAILAKENGIDTTGKTQEEIIKEISEKLDISLTKEESEIISVAKEGLPYGEGIELDQGEYEDIDFGTKTIKTDGCGVCSLYTAYTMANANYLDFEEFMVVYGPAIDKYFCGKGASNSMFKNNEFLAMFNLYNPLVDESRGYDFNGSYSWNEVHVENKLMNDLDAGYLVIKQDQSKSKLTSGGHYMLMENHPDEDRVRLYDSNGWNHRSGDPYLVDGYANGFVFDEFTGYSQYYPLCVLDPTKLNKEVTTIVDKTSDELWEEIKENASETEIGNIFNKLDDIGSDTDDTSKKTTNIWDAIKDAYIQDTIAKAEIAENEKDNLKNIKELFSGFKDEKETVLGTEGAKKELFDVKKEMAKERAAEAETNIAINRYLNQYFSNNISYDVQYKELKGFLNGCLISLPSTMNADNPPQNIIIDLHGMGEGNTGEKAFAKKGITGAITNSELSNPNAIILAPQTWHDGEGTWCGVESVKQMTKLLEDILSEYNLNREDVNITIMGNSAGGQGAVYMAKKMEGYIDKVVVMDGANSVVKASDINQPMIGYLSTQSEKNGNSHDKYMNGIFKSAVGEENVSVVQSSHVDLSKNAYNIDKNNNGISDMMEFILFGGAIDRDKIGSLIEQNETTEQTTTPEPSATPKPSATPESSNPAQVKIPILENIKNNWNEIKAKLSLGTLEQAKIDNIEAIREEISGLVDKIGAEIDELIENANKNITETSKPSANPKPTEKPKPNVTPQPSNSVQVELPIVETIKKYWEEIKGDFTLGTLEQAKIDNIEEIRKGLSGLVDKIGMEIDELIENAKKPTEQQDVKNDVLSEMQSTVNKHSIADTILQHAQMYQNRQHQQEWKYSLEGLIYHGPDNNPNTFEDVINNPRKNICCATQVACILYAAGIVTREDFVNATVTKRFNPNDVVNVNEVLKQKGYEKITEIEDLQPGDIIFYGKPLKHTDIFAGYDADGNMLFYSAGDTKSVRSIGPIKKNINNEKFRYAYRVNEPIIELEVEETARQSSIPEPSESLEPSETPKPSEVLEQSENPKPEDMSKAPSKPSKTINPGPVETPIIECTPEAIVEAAKNYDETVTHSEYILDILHESRFLSEEQIKLYEDYNLEEIQKEIETLGWGKITDKSQLQAGDIIFKKNAEGEYTAQIYAGDNKWYSVGDTTAQQMEQNWTENTNWCAYRPTQN